jgi:branched-chain amino acid aminotransferase
MFVCGTAAEITPVAEIGTEGGIIQINDGEPGPITKQLQKIYGDIVRGKMTRYENWLTYVE